MPRAAFVDRDGVINEDRHYVHRIEDFVLLPGVVEGLTRLRGAGYLLIVVTNQAGIARGYYDVTAMHKLHDYLRELLAERDVTIDAFYFCPHHPNGCVRGLAVYCGCRKPAPGLLHQAAQDFNLDLASSVLIGDKLSDVQAGKLAGVGCNVIVGSGHDIADSTAGGADLVALDLRAAAYALTSR